MYNSLQEFSAAATAARRTGRVCPYGHPHERFGAG